MAGKADKQKQTLKDLRGLKGSNPEPLRNTELEAAIHADPDDRATRLVYGDWLQIQADPRGTLIALQHAANEDTSKAAAVEAFLKKHDYQLLGLCGNHGTKLTLEWGLGFFHSATISFATSDKTLSALRDLLTHPSAQFLQELIIQPPKASNAIDFDAVAKELEDHAPTTLRHLLVGRPGQWAIPESLYQALPRLRQNDPASWAEVLEAIRGQRKLKTNIDAAKLPTLEPRDRRVKLDASDLDGGLIAMGLRMELDKERNLRLIESMNQIFTPASRDNFALAMLHQWTEAGERSPDRWIYSVVGAIGGDLCVADIGSRLAEMSHQRATTGMKHLAKIGTDAAISEIVSVSIMPSRFLPRREFADEQLATIAKSRKMTVPQLLARTAARSVGEAARVRMTETQQRWMFDLMVHGDRMSGEDFLLHVTHHATRAQLAAGLLWAEWKEDKPVRLFQLDASQTLTDANGDAVMLAKDSQVGPPHPIELNDSELNSWSKLLAHAAQPFSQLGRPAHRLSDKERNSDTLTRFAKRRVGFHRIREGLEESDWFPYKDHGIEGFGRTFRRGRAVTVVAHIGIENTGSIGEVYVQPASEMWMSGKPIALAKIHPVVISEALLNIENTLGGRADAPPASTRAKSAPPSGPSPKAGLPQRGRYPFAELAKSGRSKCVICGEKIEKQTIRVGVERMIETPNFTGKATAWLHPHCTSNCPELADMTELDARLTENSAGVWPA